MMSYAASLLLLCGTYQINGTVRSGSKGPYILIHEKTNSEITIIVPIPNEGKLAPYIGSPVTAEILVKKKSTAGSRILGEVKKIKIRNPNPLNPKDTSVELLEKVECQK